MSFIGIPNELWCIILKYAFPDVATSIKTLKASVIRRTTCKQVLDFIDRFLFRDIKCFDMDEGGDEHTLIPTTILPLFKGLKELSQLDLPQITDETLCLMPWIEELVIRNDIQCDVWDGDTEQRIILTGGGLGCLTNLQSLCIHEPTVDQAHSMSKLINLQGLDLWFNGSVDDKELGLFPGLTYLHLYEDTKITGECFSSEENKMPLLKALVISSGSILEFRYLKDLAPRLQTLHLWDHNPVTPDLLELMTNLKELHLIRTRHDYSEALKKLTSLVNLSLMSVYAFTDITDDVLSNLNQLKTLKISHNDLITSNTIVSLSHSLTHLVLAYTNRIRPRDVPCCENLKFFCYTGDGPDSLEDKEAYETLHNRGVKWDVEEDWCF